MKTWAWVLGLLTTSGVAMGEGHFGAICYALRTGAIGTSKGLYSPMAARNKALFLGKIAPADQPVCLVVDTICAAVFYDAPKVKLYSGEGKTLNEAVLVAESNCFESTMDCRYIASTCGKVASEPSQEDADSLEEK